MRHALLMSLLGVGFLTPATAAQTPDRPLVAMTVSTSDGKTTDLTAPESGMAELTLPDGAVLGIRPTILDARPWTRVQLTLFRAGAAGQQPAEIGVVETKVGAPALQSKTSPPLKISVTRVAGEADTAPRSR